jgi:hypothetical protein
MAEPRWRIDALTQWCVDAMMCWRNDALTQWRVDASGSCGPCELLQWLSSQDEPAEIESQSFLSVMFLICGIWCEVYVFLLILFQSVWLCNKYSSPKIDSVLLNEWHFHCLKTSGIRLKISFEERLKDCKTFWTESSEAGSLKFLCQSQLSQTSVTTFSQIVKRSSLGLWWSTDWVMTDLKFLKNWPQGPMLWFLVGIFLPKIFAFSTLNTAYLCKKCWYHNTDFKVKCRN